MPNLFRRASTFDYGWVIVATGTLTVFASLGLGRFALGMILPSMGAALRLSYAQLGWVGTANFIGYLGAVLVARPLAARLGSRVLVAAALLVVGASMLLMSRASGYPALVALYCVTGFGSGASNVPVMALVARWFEPARRGRAAGFVAIGSGFAIVASGRLIPTVNRVVGADGWRTSWMLLGLVVTTVAVIALAFLRDAPPTPASGALGGAPVAPPPGSALRSRAVWVLGVLYAVFGFTYAIYVTFIVTMLVREKGFSEAVAGQFWSWVGLLSLLSGPVFGTLSDRLGRRRGLVLVFAVQAVAYVLAGADLPTAFLYLSIGAFGVAAWSIPTIMIAAVSDYVGADRALGAFGVITFFFGVGQITGPALAGTLAQRAGSFSSSFFLAAALAGAAIVVSGLLPRPHLHPIADRPAGAPSPQPRSAGRWTGDKPTPTPAGEP
jgi:MFS family permease